MPALHEARLRRAAGTTSLRKVKVYFAATRHGSSRLARLGRGRRARDSRGSSRCGLAGTEQSRRCMRHMLGDASRDLPSRDAEVQARLPRLLRVR